MHSLRDTLQGAVVMAPMTKGSNLPYRQLCIELGARITMSEMTVARRLTQKRTGESALIRTATDRGVVAVFDSRLGTANYRWDLVRALPPMKRTRHRAEAEEFLRNLRN